MSKKSRYVLWLVESTNGGFRYAYSHLQCLHLTQATLAASYEKLGFLSTPTYELHLTQATLAQNDQEPVIPTQPVYIQPQVTVYEEEELLKTVAVLGCSPF